MVIVFALLAALSNAVNVVTQHVASTAVTRSSGWRLAVYLFRNPLWLSGWVALVAAFVFQALALHMGLISVVQPLLATELVFALVLRRFWIRQSIRPATWAAAGVTCAGLAVFIVAGEPQGGQATPVSRHWLTAGLACCVGAGLLAIAARWGSPGRRAALYASAAAVMWALVATFIKATTDTLTQFGLGGMFTHWPVYALAVGSVAALLLAQAALHVGPLRVSQPFLVIIDPIVSIALSTWLFDEHFTSDTAVLAMAAIAFAVMGGGVVLLTQTAPATMEADIRNGATETGSLIPGVAIARLAACQQAGDRRPHRGQVRSPFHPQRHVRGSAGRDGQPEVDEPPREHPQRSHAAGDAEADQQQRCYRVDNPQASRRDRERAGDVGDPVGREQFDGVDQVAERGHEAPQRGGVKQPVE